MTMTETPGNTDVPPALGDGSHRCNTGHDRTDRRRALPGLILMLLGGLPVVFLNGAWALAALALLASGGMLFASAFPRPPRADTPREMKLPDVASNAEAAPDGPVAILRICALGCSALGLALSFTTGAKGVGAVLIALSLVLGWIIGRIARRTQRPLRRRALTWFLAPWR